MTKKTSIIQNIQAKLKSTLVQNPELLIDRKGRLPSLSKLSQEFNCSEKIVSDVLQNLAEENLLVLNPRRAAQLKSHIDKAFSKQLHKPKAHEELAKEIRNQILTGVFRIDETLPKVRYFCINHNVSNHTVHSACKLLQEEGWLRKIGKNWKVGPKTKERNEKSRTHQPQKPWVAIILPNLYHWHSLNKDTVFQKFIWNLIGESERFNVRIVLFGGGLVEPHFSGTVVGDKSAENYLSENINSYFGSIFICSPLTLTDFDKWVNMIIKFKKPIVWINRHTGKQPEQFSIFPLLPKTNFYVGHISEKVITDSTLNYLKEMGHCRIGFFMNNKPHNWTINRYESLKNSIDEIDEIELISSGNFPSHDLLLLRFHKQFPLLISELYRRCPEPWRKAFHRLKATKNAIAKKPITPIHSPKPDMEAVLDSVQKFEPFDAVTPKVMEIAKEITFVLQRMGYHSKDTSFLYFIPFFLPLLAREPCSVILAANDQFANNAFTWLQQAGYQIPNDVSLLGIDNQFSRLFPFSSVDPGYGPMAYATFHLIMNDIKVKTKKNRLEISPYISDKGSVKKYHP